MYKGPKFCSMRKKKVTHTQVSNNNGRLRDESEYVHPARINAYLVASAGGRGGHKHTDRPASPPAGTSGAPQPVVVRYFVIRTLAIWQQAACCGDRSGNNRTTSTAAGRASPFGSPPSSPTRIIENNRNKAKRQSRQAGRATGINSRKSGQAASFIGR